MAIAVIQDTAQGLGNELVILIEGTTELQAVTKRQGVNRSKGQTLDLADQGLGCAVGFFQAEAGELALGIAVAN
ncbi:MAG: hypothetical protein N0C88_21785 [Candidatus Thiodiazotropha lotti]|uniref:Uncharacterized protein n=1 Tax=Candidatus Thiodiazotropha lotti TaxID=2792787 RepID=A0A9E4K977_9GAMM|nr:hypothetical protein [Candidatus Thiodiazotropha lotti]MCW4205937.1 hypothetical protein [Candidatus Thiodiazotropha lotti]